MSFTKYVVSRYTLGTALMRHVLTEPFAADRGPKPWLAKIRAEGLAPVPRELWSYLGGTSRCIGCGLCDAIDTDQPVSQVIMGAAREPSIAPLAVDRAAELRACAAEISAICPARVPAEDVARLLEENTAALGAASERQR